MALDEIKKRIYEFRERILLENREFTVNSLKEKWFGEDRNKRTLLGVVRLSIIDLEKLVSKGIYKKSTLTKYKTTEKHLVEFLRWRNNGCDVLLVNLKFEFAGHLNTICKPKRDLP